MKAIISYLSEVRTELSKVIWPGKDQVIKLTLIVILISGFVGIYVGILDFVLTRGLSLLLTR